MVATWLLSTWYVASVTKELNLALYLIKFKKLHVTCGYHTGQHNIKP